MDIALTEAKMTTASQLQTYLQAREGHVWTPEDSAWVEATLGELQATVRECLELACGKGKGKP